MDWPGRAEAVCAIDIAIDSRITGKVVKREAKEQYGGLSQRRSRRRVPQSD